MAISNRDRIQRTLETLRDGLIPFVERTLKASWGGDWIKRLDQSSYNDAPKNSDGSVHWDNQLLFKTLLSNWNSVFKSVLGHAERAYVGELLEVRNAFAHDRPFSSEDTLRSLDTAQRLLMAVSARMHAETIDKLRAELQRTVFAEQARQQTRSRTSTLESAPQAGLKPWREVITPHRDVASGRYAQAEFAADLAQVQRGEATTEYSDPTEFYQRTFLTEGLRHLLRSAMLRLSGQGGDPVYDVLGRLFEAQALRDLLVEAIRYGERPETRARLFQAVDHAVDRDHLLALLEDRALTHETLALAQVNAIREAMERAEARRLQPHYIQGFFLEAFQHLGGRLHSRERGRWKISRVPGPIRERDRLIGIGEAVLPRYERVCFEKDRINQPPVATFLCPGHPLLDTTLDLILEHYRDLLKRGAVLVDEADDDDPIRALFYLEHAVQDGRIGRHGQQQIISQRLQFVEVKADGATLDAGPAPYFDYRPLAEAERTLIQDRLAADWLAPGLENQVMTHAVTRIVPRHVEELRTRRLPEIDRVERAVTDRLKREIIYWDHRAEELKAQERADKQTRLSSANAAARANDLADRLQRRLTELDKERDISALPPVIRGGAIVVPGGLLRRLAAPPLPEQAVVSAESRAQIERLAMQAVMAAERSLGFEPRDVSAERVGYDIESRDPESGRLRFIEVKGRI